MSTPQSQSSLRGASVCQLNALSPQREYTPFNRVGYRLTRIINALKEKQNVRKVQEVQVSGPGHQDRD